MIICSKATLDVMQGYMLISTNLKYIVLGREWTLNPKLLSQPVALQLLGLKSGFPNTFYQLFKCRVTLLMYIYYPCYFIRINL